MSNALDTMGKAAILLALLVFAISLGTSTGAFTTSDLSRPSGIQLGSDGEALVGLDITDSISVACGERLVTVTNNFDHQADFEVTILEFRDGEVALSESGAAGDSVSFSLSPGESQPVYISNVKGPIWDDVEFDITASTVDTDVSLSKQVPKVPGNEDDDDGDDNWGGDGCDDEDDEDDDDEDDEDEDDEDEDDEDDEDEDDEDDEDKDDEDDEDEDDEDDDDDDDDDDDERGNNENRGKGNGNGR